MDEVVWPCENLDMGRQSHSTRLDRLATGSIVVRFAYDLHDYWESQGKDHPIQKVTRLETKSKLRQSLINLDMMDCLALSFQYFHSYHVQNYIFPNYTISLFLLISPRTNNLFPLRPSSASQISYIPKFPNPTSTHPVSLSVTISIS